MNESLSIRIGEHSKFIPRESFDERLNTIANSYMVTLVNFSNSTGPSIEVIDSRIGLPAFAADTQSKESIYTPAKDVTLRLLIAEDLPRPTFELLERVFGADPGFLSDHRRNGRGFLSQPDLDIDVADRQHSISVALPFDFQVGPDVLMNAFEDSGIRSDEEDVVDLLKCHQMVNYLRHNWQTIAVKAPLPCVFSKTYRRLSIHVSTGRPDTGNL